MLIGPACILCRWKRVGTLALNVTSYSIPLTPYISAASPRGQVKIVVRREGLPRGYSSWEVSADAGMHAPVCW